MFYPVLQRINIRRVVLPFEMEGLLSSYETIIQREESMERRQRSMERHQDRMIEIFDGASLHQRAVLVMQLQSRSLLGRRKNRVVPPQEPRGRTESRGDSSLRVPTMSQVATAVQTPARSGSSQGLAGNQTSLNAEHSFSNSEVSLPEIHRPRPYDIPDKESESEASLKESFKNRLLRKCYLRQKKARPDLRSEFKTVGSRVPTPGPAFKAPPVLDDDDDEDEVFQSAVRRTARVNSDARKIAEKVHEQVSASLRDDEDNEDRI